MSNKESDKLKKQFEIAFKNHDPKLALEIIRRHEGLRHRSNEKD